MPKSAQYNIPVPELAVDVEAIRNSMVNHVQHTQGKHPDAATRLDEYFSLARVARDRIFDRWTRTWHHRMVQQPKLVYYLSMEYLLGRLLEDGLLSLGILPEAKDALGELDIDFDATVNEEPDPGLGNGGLGRLAACFMDSLATLGIAAMGYGLRYEYGIFRQDIVGGTQHENPDMWLQNGSPWEVVRPERVYEVKFGGRVIQYTSSSGALVREWVDTRSVHAIPYDIPVPGYRNGIVNTLRLWSARATRDFDISYFNQGDYVRAVEEQSHKENITRVLYPNDEQLAGKELRLKQEYLLVSATLQDALRRHLRSHPDVYNLPDQAVFQLNDTHPALAVAELMRLLVDEHDVPWDRAWSLTRRSLAYTNHTILPEALEKWPLWLVERLLPRHLQIIYDINEAFLKEVGTRFPGDVDRIQRMSVIEEGVEKKIRMANLAVIGSQRVNGVSALHSRLLREHLFRDFAEFDPARFTNQTNGVTPRRWLLKCNPGLAELITEKVGTHWPTRLNQLQLIEQHAVDPDFQARWQAVKRKNKERLALVLKNQAGIELDPTHLLDSQVKRIHEYKRQLLNVLQIVSTYLKLRDDPGSAVVPRTYLFAGKAAPGYDMAKRIIQLVNSVASTLSADPRTRDMLQVIFVPNYNVTLAEYIIPATDVSEQISTAGMEASGTGNMKFAMNGALTVGTLDGANIEIMDAVGAENMFIFGLTAEAVEAARHGGYDPMSLYFTDPSLKAALDAVASGVFSPDEPGRFRPIVDALLYGGDRFMVLADFLSYLHCQQSIEKAYVDQATWTRKAIVNVSRMGRFSSDRTIIGYAREIWGVTPTRPSVLPGRGLLDR